MGDGGNLPVALTLQLGPAHVTLAVVGFQAHFGGHLQCFFQGSGGAFAKGLAGGRSAFHTGNIHQAFDIGQQSLPVALHKLIHCCAQLYIYHGFISPYVRRAQSTLVIGLLYCSTNRRKMV